MSNFCVEHSPFGNYETAFWKTERLFQISETAFYLTHPPFAFVALCALILSFVVEFVVFQAAFLVLALFDTASCAMNVDGEVLVKF